MRPILIISLISLLSIQFSNSQKIFSTDYKSQADINVFVTDYESQADLKVYKVDYPSQARGNEGNWF